MKKDKITIAYILMTITIVVLVSVFFFKLDLNENNANLEMGANKAFKSGKVYSEKMYTMINGYAKNLMTESPEANVTITDKKPSKGFVIGTTAVVIKDKDKVIKDSNITTSSKAGKVSTPGHFNISTRNKTKQKENL